MIIIHGGDKDHPRCIEHGSPTRYTIHIGNVGIPMCQICMKDLKKKLNEMDLCIDDVVINRRNR